MSTMKKRIPMFLLALAMMVAMALPTFAASPPYSARVWIYNCENSIYNIILTCQLVTASLIPFSILLTAMKKMSIF